MFLFYRKKNYTIIFISLSIFGKWKKGWLQFQKIFSDFGKIWQNTMKRFVKAVILIRINNILFNINIHFIKTYVLWCVALLSYEVKLKKN